MNYANQKTMYKLTYAKQPNNSQVYISLRQ